MNTVPAIVLQSPQTAQLSAWLQENLFFVPVYSTGTPANTPYPTLLHNGNCVLRLCSGESGEYGAPDAGAYYTGLAHIALNTTDIAAAETYCRKKGLTLADVGSFNPKVYGQGEYYFNILSPFGITFEVSQKAAGGTQAAAIPLQGLDHVGIPAPVFEDEIAFFKSRGFVPAFSPVENQNDKEGRIRCVMLEKDGFVLEVYQFLDLAPKALPQPSALHGIQGFEEGVSPGGVSLLSV